METIRKLKEQRSSVMAQWSDLLKVAETREWTPEETQMVAQLQAMVEDLDKRVLACEAYVESDPAEDAKAAETNAADEASDKDKETGSRNKKERRRSAALSLT